MAETSQNPQALGHETDEPQLNASERTSAEAGALEATELRRLQLQYSRASSYRPPARTLSPKPTSLIGRVKYGVGKFWKHQISIIVEHSTCRDHLALERTFLGYVRTSLALSMIGITVAQLFRLQQAPTPSHTFGFFVLGKPLSCLLQGSAIFTVLVGGFRTWRSQNAIVRGKAISGGFEIVAIMAFIFLILLTFFIILIVVDVEKEDL